jgi:hypothetical protein
MYIEPRLIEFSRTLNTELSCTFRDETSRVAWSRNYQFETPKEDAMIGIAADILMKDYVPTPILFSYYSGWADGDDQLYPQV